jgi:hypothetical protein
MGALYIVGTVVPGQVTPATSDEARGQPGFIEVQRTGDGIDSIGDIRTPPLLADACRCRSAWRCMHCRRWTRHERTVRARRALWARKGWV